MKLVILVGDYLGGDQSGNNTIWESDYLLPRPYEMDVLSQDVLARDVVSDYHVKFNYNSSCPKSSLPLFAICRKGSYLGWMVSLMVYGPI